MYLALYMPNDANFLALELLDRSLEPAKSPRSSFCLSELKMKEFIAYQAACVIVEH